MEIKIEEVKRIFDLTKKVNCAHSAKVAEVAKEMGVKKTALMQYIEDNPKLFETKTDDKGLIIKDVYLTFEENPHTDEWLAVKKKEWEKKVCIFEKTYYHVHEFYYIDVDFPKDYGPWRTDEYRNTKEKIEELEKAGIITKSKLTYGGLSDYYTMEAYAVDSKVLKAIEDYGWTTNFDEIKKK